MIRQVAFTGSSTHQVYFRMLYEAYRSRGSAAPETRVSSADRRSDGKILKALKGIGQPIGDAPIDGELDLRPLTLRSGGGTIALEQPEFALLQKYVENTQFVSALADLQCDLDDWLDAAERIS